jgi:Fic/DOC family
MWVATPSGNSFIPDDLRQELIDSLPDRGFPDFFKARDHLQETVEAAGNADVYATLLFQRDSQTFSSRLSGATHGDIAYVTTPFVPFHIFDSIDAFNFASAAQYAWSRDHSKPYSKRFLCEIHRRLMPSKPWAGSFRKQAVWMGRRRSKVDEATIVLAPSRYVNPAFRKLGEFADNVPQTHRLAACAMIHYQLIAIHPFSDANGRVVRVITPLLLRHYGLIGDGMLFVSEVLLEHRWDYYSRVVSTERHDETRAWILFFVEMMTKQLENHGRLIQLAMRLRTALIQMLGAHLKANVAGDFADEILLSPIISLSRMAKVAGCSQLKARELVKALDGRFGLGLISDATDPVYQFRDLYDLLSL